MYAPLRRYEGIDQARSEEITKPRTVTHGVPALVERSEDSVHERRPMSEAERTNVREGS